MAELARLVAGVFSTRVEIMQTPQPGIPAARYVPSTRRAHDELGLKTWIPLEEAIARYGRPEIFNTDQGSQFTSFAFTKVLKDNGIRISMDGKGRWMDNVFIERLWRSLKYECVYLHAFETGSEAKAGIGSWISYYNGARPHSALDGRTPSEAYAMQIAPPGPELALGLAPAPAQIQLAA